MAESCRSSSASLPMDFPSCRPLRFPHQLWHRSATVRFGRQDVSGNQHRDTLHCRAGPMSTRIAPMVQGKVERGVMVVLLEALSHTVIRPYPDDDARSAEPVNVERGSAVQIDPSIVPVSRTQTALAGHDVEESHPVEDRP